MNIAIIDDLKTDSDRLVELINTYMEQHRLQCRTMDLFSSGEAFLDTFTAGKYHLIFLDIYMDGITGMETAKRIRQTDHDCRIIFITTSPEFADWEGRCFFRPRPVRTSGGRTVQIRGGCNCLRKDTASGP